jgi:hypothetical protein
MKFTKEKLLEFFETYEGSTLGETKCFHAALGRITVYYALLDSVEKSKSVEKIDNDDKGQILKWVARQNFVINAVTTLELFLKESIVEMSGRWNEDGFKKLLEQSVSLNEAFHLMRLNSKVTKEAVLSYFSSFQSIESIDKVFSDLVGEKNFIKQLDRFVKSERIIGDVQLREKSELYTLFCLTEKWRKRLVELFRYRNQFVHEGEFSFEVDAGYAEDVLELVLTFAYTFDRFMNQRLPQNETTKTEG